MTVRIEAMCSETEKQYEDLLTSVPSSMLYHSLQYRNFLRQVLVDAKDRYLLAFDNEKLVAAIPAFVKPGRFGPVVNSLPFYGSNGSLVVKKGCSEKISRELLQTFDQMCREENAVTSTIVGNPLETNGSLFDDYFPDLLDERIGQITPLPSDVPPHKIKDQLLSSFHVKTRNLVRKGEKSGFEISHDGNESTLLQLYELHESNMKAIGGLSKPWLVFRAIQQNFKYDRDYRVYSAKKDGQFTAGLLMFYFNRTAEYFIPVIHQQFRSQQPLSYLIFLAMQDAVSKRCRRWNWGGTWLSQYGVYHFKSRWGTADFPYQYYIKVHSDIECIKYKDRKELLLAYPYFYVIPFSSLEGQ